MAAREGSQTGRTVQEEPAEELAQQRSQAGASTSEAGPGDDKPKQGKKRKAGKDQSAEEVIAKHAERAAKAKQEGQQWFDLKQNTSVYVTGLPTDVTEPELAEVGTRCCAAVQGSALLSQAPRLQASRWQALGLCASRPGAPREQQQAPGPPPGPLGARWRLRARAHRCLPSAASSRRTRTARRASRCTGTGSPALPRATAG